MAEQNYYTKRDIEKEEQAREVFAKLREHIGEEVTVTYFRGITKYVHSGVLKSVSDFSAVEIEGGGIELKEDYYERTRRVWPYDKWIYFLGSDGFSEMGIAQIILKKTEDVLFINPNIKNYFSAMQLSEFIPYWVSLWGNIRADILIEKKLINLYETAEGEIRKAQNELDEFVSRTREKYSGPGMAGKGDFSRSKSECLKETLGEYSLRDSSKMIEALKKNIGQIVTCKFLDDYTTYENEYGEYETFLGRVKVEKCQLDEVRDFRYIRVKSLDSVRSFCINFVALMSVNTEANNLWYRNSIGPYYWGYYEGKCAPPRLLFGDTKVYELAVEDKEKELKNMKDYYDELRRKILEARKRKKEIKSLTLIKPELKEEWENYVEDNMWSTDSLPYKLFQLLTTYTRNDGYDAERLYEYLCSNYLLYDASASIKTSELSELVKKFLYYSIYGDEFNGYLDKVGAFQYEPGQKGRRRGKVWHNPENGV